MFTALALPKKSMDVHGERGRALAGKTGKAVAASILAGVSNMYGADMQNPAEAGGHDETRHHAAFASAMDSLLCFSESAKVQHDRLRVQWSIFLVANHTLTRM